MNEGGVRGLVQATLRRPVTILMLLCSTVLIGVIAGTNIPLELLPSGFVVSSLSISIPVPNSNPVEVEEQITKPTEDVLRQVSGLEELDTSSSKDRSRLDINFAKGVDPDEAFAEVRDLMEVAKLSWPEDVQEYFTFRFNPDTDIPIISFGLLLDEWESDTSFIVDEKVIKEIESVDGVARVDAWGIVEESIRIFIDKEKARALGISLFDVAQALSADNRDVIGGRIEDGGRHFYLRSLGRFQSIEEIEDYPIRANLRLKQIAEVTSAQALRNFVFRLNGKRAIWFNVNKEATANTVDVCRRVRQRLDEKVSRDTRLIEKGWTWFRPELRDIGRVIESALDNLLSAALIGGLLALLPLLLFLRRIRLTLIITLAIPTSLLITVGCLYFSGGSMNLLSMMGITIAIGMLVDNSIVVVESIFRHRQLGVAPVRAALLGTAEVALAITLATLTTVVAFVPLMFMDAGADISFFSKAIGLPVCYSVLASLLVALAFIPLATVVLYGTGTRSRGLLEPADPATPRTPLGRTLGAAVLPLVWATSATHAVLDFIQAAHRRILLAVLANRFVTLLLTLVVCTALTQVAWETMSKSNFADEAGGQVRVSIELDSNYTLIDANEVFGRVYERMATLKDEIGLDYTFYWFRNTGGTMNAGLLDRDPDHTKWVVGKIKEILPQIPGAKITVGVERQDDNRSAIQMQVYGDDVAVLAEVALDLTERLESIPRVLAVRGSLESENDEIVVEPDRERMQRLGVDPRVLMGTVQYGIRGQRLPDFHAGDQKMQMYVEFDDADTTTFGDLAAMGIRSARSNRSLPLSDVADIRYSRGYGTIRKENGRSSVQLTIETLGDDKEAVTAAIKASLAGYALPDGVTWRETSAEDFRKELLQVVGTAVLAIILILLLMGVLFESVLLPLAVFSTIYFAIAGMIWALRITGTPLDMVGMIGAIILIGVVVNNGIVFLDCAHRLVQEGADRTTALVEAGQRRLRPIFMTTATTVVGLLPMALTEASGSFISYKSLARGVMGGMIVSTAATLVIVPIVYALLGDMRALFFEALRSVFGTERTSAGPSEVVATTGAAESLGGVHQDDGSR